MPSSLGRGIDTALDGLDLIKHLPLPSDNTIPADVEAFYTDFGVLTHPRTRAPVTQLANYQIETWKGLHQFKRVLEVKSNKVGETTKWLIADFHLAVLPSSHPLSCRGFDQLVIAQTKDHAKEHLHTLRKLILNSKKYRGFLISQPDEVTLRDEATKVSVIYIKNPENNTQPSRIIGLGLNNAGSILSWKNVKHIHISDPTAAEGDITEAINGAMTRLANTDGSMVIETVPSGPSGRIYEMYQQYNSKGAWQSGDFKVYHVTADDAVRAGVMTSEFIEQEKQHLGVLFPRYYQAQFMEGEGNLFPAELVDLCVQHYDLTMKDGRKILAVDPGWGSSKFGLVGVEKIDDIIYVKEAKEWERANPSAMLDVVAGIYNRDGYRQCYVDGSQAGTITDLKAGSDASGRRPLNVQSVSFRESLSEMTMNLATLLKEGRIRIHPAFSELIYQLKAVQDNGEGHPDKKHVKFDLGDALLMAAFKARNNDVHAVRVRNTEFLRTPYGRRYYG